MKVLLTPIKFCFPPAHYSWIPGTAVLCCSQELQQLSAFLWSFLVCRYWASKIHQIIRWQQSYLCCHLEFSGFLSSRGKKSSNNEFRYFEEEIVLYFQYINAPFLSSCQLAAGFLNILKNSNISGIINKGKSVQRI